MVAYSWIRYQKCPSRDSWRVLPNATNRTPTHQWFSSEHHETVRPITALAEIDAVRSHSEINRIDQARSITVASDLDETVGNATEIVEDLQANFMPGVLTEFPMVRLRWEGQQE